MYNSTVKNWFVCADYSPKPTVYFLVYSTSATTDKLPWKTFKQLQYQITYLFKFDSLRCIFCDLVAPLVWIIRTSKKQEIYPVLHNRNFKYFCSSQYLFNIRSYDRKHLIFQFNVECTLVWRVSSVFTPST